MRNLLLIAALTIVAWTEAHGQTSAPRLDRAVGFYDATIQRIVLVGGSSEPLASNRDQLWSWTGARWELVSDSGPPARSLGGVAYDARRRAVIVAGGTQRATSGGAYQAVSDAWQGTASTWSRIAGAEFTARDHLSMVYDDRRQSVLMFGGMLADRSWPADTWELRPTGWTRVATDGPPGRGRTALAYDVARQHVVLFGGVGGAAAGQQQPFYSDTWVWENSQWRKLADDGPRGRYAHGMVYDERARVVLMYSGAGAHRGAPLSDMWQWDGTRWSQIQLSGATPGFRYQPIMVYDRARSKTVLYGGFNESGAMYDTWEWDGASWKQIQ